MYSIVASLLCPFVHTQCVLAYTLHGCCFANMFLATFLCVLGGPGSRDIPGIPDEAAETGCQLHPADSGVGCGRCVGEDVYRWQCGCKLYG